MPTQRRRGLAQLLDQPLRDATAPVRYLGCISRQAGKGGHSADTYVRQVSNFRLSV